MKPYNVEIFDRQFNFLYNALLDEQDFSHGFDVLSPDKNTIPIPKTFVPSELSDSPRAPKGWYIRIFRDSEEFQGVITGFQAGEVQGSIEYSQLVTLFDIELLVDTKEILNTNIEAYIKKLITQAFITSTDTEQNIYGLLADSISTVSTTAGILPYADSNDEKIIVNFLDDIILPAANTYQVFTMPALNVADKTISVTVGINSDAAKDIEADLPGVIDPSFTIRKISDEINRADLYDEYKALWYYYFLHSDGSYNTTNTDRLIPVNNMITVFNSYDLAKAQIDANISSNQNILKSYLTTPKTLTDTELDLLQLAIGNIWDRWIKDKLAIIINAYYVEDILSYYWIDCELSTGRSVEVGDFTTTIEFYPIRYELRDEPTRGATPIYIYHNNIGVEEGLIPWDPTPYYNSHVYVYGKNIEITARWGSDPIQEYSDTISEVYGVLDYNVVKNELDKYKKSRDYENDIVTLANQLTSTYPQTLAKEAFSKNKYSNLIEITVEKDNTLINPMNLSIGQVVNIIHEGVSYSTLLTGREIQKNGLVKLIFGTIRLELTKILNMKGI